MADLTRKSYHKAAGFQRGDRVEFWDDGEYMPGGWTTGTVQTVRKYSDGHYTLHIDADNERWRTVERSVDDARKLGSGPQAGTTPQAEGA